MRRIVRAEAVCLRVQDLQESSKLVTLFTLGQGKVTCIAKGARRLKSKFGAALDLFAVSRVIYYWHETKSLYTLSDAELIRYFPALMQLPGRFLAAEQMAEFVLKTTQPHDPHPGLYRLLLTYLSSLESCAAPPSVVARRPSFARYPVSCLLSATPCPTLVCSFLLKASSFLGFRPELRRCLVCRKTLNGSASVYFDAGRGGAVCPACAGENLSAARLSPEELASLTRLLYTPAAELAEDDSRPNELDLVLAFIAYHFDPLVLKSFRWPKGLEG
jgi:DNA repair protein RecO (recombination protein O)